MPSLRIILLYIRHHSCRELLRKLLAAAIRPVHERREALIVYRTADRPPVARSDDIVEFTPDDLDRMLDVMYVSRQGLLDRFARRERCFGAVQHRRITSFFWSQVGLKDLYELHLRFRLRPNQAWLYNAITVKAARGRGLYPTIIGHMIATLREDGVTDCYVDLLPRNRASARGLEKAGFARVVVIRMRKWFSRVRYQAVVFDRARWDVLSGLIAGFDPRQWTISESPDRHERPDPRVV